MRGLILIIYTVILFIFPLNGMTRMTPLSDGEMEEVSARTGISLGFDFSSLSADYISYCDSDGYSGGTTTAGYLNLTDLNVDFTTTTQSEITLDVATVSATSYLNIGFSPLQVTFADIPDGAPGTDVFDFSTPTAGTTKWGWWSDDANTSGGGNDPQGETPFNAANYTNVSADDTLYVETDSPDDKTHRFVFTTNLGSNRVTEIYTKAVVYSESSVNQRLYIKNFDTGTYHELDFSTTGGAWETMEGTIAGITNSFIDDATGEIWIMYWAADPGFLDRFMRTDYVRVEVTSYLPGQGGARISLRINDAQGSAGTYLGRLELSGTPRIEGNMKIWGH
ncbi:MAG: hypothetical protein SWO11_04825 [Thermodesulfobacteriota bacterium]|nr:hypothetical protein [Thermodesulfobacteriota bacterium]